MVGLAVVRSHGGSHDEETEDEEVAEAEDTKAVATEFEVEGFGKGWASSAS